MTPGGWFGLIPLPGGETGAGSRYARVFTPPVLAVFDVLSERVCANKFIRPVTNKKMTPPEILISSPCQSLLLAGRVASEALDPARAIRYHP